MNNSPNIKNQHIAKKRISKINNLDNFNNQQNHHYTNLNNDEDYQKVKRFISPFEWPEIKKQVAHINHLKKLKNVIILAHNYMTPEIYSLVADFRGDSLALAKDANNINADIILQAGVVFMAETTKILNMNKRVLIPDLQAGCSLAASITPDDVIYLKRKYPNVPVLCYVNTDAAVKALVDICVTSGNAIDIVNSLKDEKIIFIPDKYLAQNVAQVTNKKIITWEGTCIVHETFSKHDITAMRKAYPNIKIIVHPECPDEIVKLSDFSGSTSKMAQYVQQHKPQDVALITECSMSDNVANANPDVNFIKPCNLCPYMKKITLENIITCLENEQYEINIDPMIAKKAKTSIDAMLDLNSTKFKDRIPIQYINKSCNDYITDNLIIEHRQT